MEKLVLNLCNYFSLLPWKPLERILELRRQGKTCVWVFIMTTEIHLWVGRS